MKLTLSCLVYTVFSLVGFWIYNHHKAISHSLLRIPFLDVAFSLRGRSVVWQMFREVGTKWRLLITIGRKLPSHWKGGGIFWIYWPYIHVVCVNQNLENVTKKEIFLPSFFWNPPKPSLLQFIPVSVRLNVRESQMLKGTERNSLFCDSWIIILLKIPFLGVLTFWGRNAIFTADYWFN